MIKNFEENKAGRDFVVGDIHGCYDLLMAALESVGFDRAVDRLFSVGDLVDRGDKNMECLRLILEPWFHAVQGNHEEMMHRAQRGHDVDMWRRNGGAWVDKDDRAEFAELCEKARELPLLIDVEAMIDGELHRIGVCHADPPMVWHEDSVREESVLWGRSRITNARADWAPRDVEDVDYVVVGHTPLKEPVAVGNVLYIDTGAVFGGKMLVGGKADMGYLTLVELKDVPRMVKEKDYRNAIKKSETA